MKVKLLRRLRFNFVVTAENNSAYTIYKKGSVPVIIKGWHNMIRYCLSIMEDAYPKLRKRNHERLLQKFKKEELARNKKIFEQRIYPNV